MRVNARITGVAELDRLLRNLPKDLDRKFFTQLQRRMLKPVAADMKADLASQTTAVTHNLEKAIGVRTMPKRSRVGTGTMAGQRYGSYKGFHAAIIEGGTQARRPRKSKVLRFVLRDGTEVFTRKTKPQRARPFIQPNINKWLPKLESSYPEESRRYMEKFEKKYL